MKIMTKSQYREDYDKAVDIFNEHIQQINEEFNTTHPEKKDVRDDPDGPNWTAYQKFVSEKLDPLIKDLNFKLDVYLMFNTIEEVTLI